MRRVIYKFLYNYIYMNINYPNIGQTNINQMPMFMCYDYTGEKQQPGMIYAVLETKFKYVAKFNQEYFLDMVKKLLFDETVCFVTRKDFNICMVYFMVHNKLQLSVKSATSFVFTQYNPFSEIYKIINFLTFPSVEKLSAKTGFDVNGRLECNVTLNAMIYLAQHYKEIEYVSKEYVEKIANATCAVNLTSKTNRDKILLADSASFLINNKFVIIKHASHNYVVTNYGILNVLGLKEYLNDIETAYLICDE